MRLAGARVLITGASSGIGRATAAVFADAGCDLVLTGRDPERLHEVADATGGETIIADLSQAAEVSRLAEWAGTPDIMIHSAGLGHWTPAAEEDPVEAERLLAVNLLAPIRLTRALLPGMLSAGAGHLVFVASIAGELGVASESSYSASKAGLGAYAASLRAELSGTGLGVTTVVPGAVDTPFFAHRPGRYRRSFPRPVRAEAVATAIRRAVVSERPRVVVPRWLAVAIAVNACAPRLYARAAGRWG